MSNTDLLSDVLTRVRNGQKAKHSFVITPSSKLAKAVFAVLREEGYINNYEEFEERKGVCKLKIDLKYHKGLPVIQELVRVSKPGRRVYSSIGTLGKMHGGLGVIILSTPQGVISDSMARSLSIGGEVLCKVF